MRLLLSKNITSIILYSAGFFNKFLKFRKKFTKPLFFLGIMMYNVYVLLCPYDKNGPENHMKGSILWTSSEFR
ncbi:MAG TPA: hypothetical protein DDX72_04530 [Ruminococcaceae bacterium]|nr:hypothetical protein [Oscillospiraceae bacterium]